MQPSPCRRSSRCLGTIAALTAFWFAPTRNMQAFTVVKNVNDGKPPIEKAVIFEKGKPTDHLTLESSESCKTGFTQDGSIESRIVGHDAVKIVIHWKPKGDLKETFDAKNYGYLLLTCRLEGSNKETQQKGKVSEQRPDNLWFGPVLFDSNGVPVGYANMADVAEDGKTPKQTVTLKFPMILLTYWGNDASHVQGIGFTWGKSRPTTDRDFRLVIDKIALAD